MIPVKEFYHQEGHEQVDNCRNQQEFQVSGEWVYYAPLCCYKQVLGVPYRADDASDCDCKCKGNQQNFRIHSVVFCKKQDNRGPYYGEGIVHQNCRGNAHEEQYYQYKLVQSFCPPEYPVRQM